MPGVVRSHLAVCRHSLLPLEDVHRASITKLEIVYVDARADSHTMMVRGITNLRGLTPATLVSIINLKQRHHKF